MTMKGKTALITGSTDGVGRYVAERLAAEGARVIVHGRDRARGEAVVERIMRQGGDARLLIADLSSLAEVRSLAEAVRRDVGRSRRAGQQRRNRHERGASASSAPTASNCGSRSITLPAFC